MQQIKIIKIIIKNLKNQILISQNFKFNVMYQKRNFSVFSIFINVLITIKIKIHSFRKTRHDMKLLRYLRKQINFLRMIELRDSKEIAEYEGESNINRNFFV